ncbi:MAG: Gfo/Idh/MocA family oxidoreductase [Acidobacteriia bacterium]|nr:Gfo/Idh/MocA family oxidoreductase [Terriglobia bacterium]MYG02126.1 Gfo/Idh/MocA family oxidoreductase [Terriglobia bacterium]MYK08196.1 Gfo/Idh/MocA family oxidoreductase [Terriglobia bacterium]
MDTKPASRRLFLAHAAAAPAVAAAPAASRVLGANDRINIGMIGTGSKGRSHLRRLMARAGDQDDVRVTAISDIYRKRSEEALDLAQLGGKRGYVDYRDLLAQPDIDAVWISTPDHWHATMALDALAAGKDVYLEKPMTYTIEEARRIAEAVESTGRILQVGSQHVSDQRYHQARQVIDEGWIGPVLWAQNTYCRNSLYGEWNYTVDPEGTPENIDWDKFLGSAPARPFSPERFFRWRKYWDYSGGIATDLFYHRLAPLMLMMGKKFPTRVSGHGGIYVHREREVPDTYATVIEYGSHYVNLSASMASAAGNVGMPTVVYGHEGAITFLPDAIEVRPEYQFASKFRESTGQDLLRIEVEQPDVSNAHIGNFLGCMRNRSKPVFDAQFGYQAMTAIRLGVDSYRSGRMMAFDPHGERARPFAGPRPGYEGSGQNFEEPPRRPPRNQRRTSG